MKENEIMGAKGRAEATVTRELTAAATGSGLTPVFATPAMATLMEHAATLSVLDALEPEEGTVGVRLELTHESATPMGMKVWAESEVIAVDGRRITFSVSAYDEAGRIGFGQHTRVVVNETQFLNNARKKLPQD